VVCTSELDVEEGLWDRRRICRRKMSLAERKKERGLKYDDSDIWMPSRQSGGVAK
jgi:hypothetical protein